MKESATISLSLIRSRLANQESGFNFMTSDIHVHVPSGATPKDGPSAGVTLFTALASLITGRTADPDLAMTGEITLSGRSCRSGGSRRRSLPHTGQGSKDHPASGERTGPAGCSRRCPERTCVRAGGVGRRGLKRGAGNGDARTVTMHAGTALCLPTTSDFSICGRNSGNLAATPSLLYGMALGQPDNYVCNPL